MRAQEDDEEPCVLIEGTLNIWARNYKLYNPEDYAEYDYTTDELGELPQPIGHPYGHLLGVRPYTCTDTRHTFSPSGCLHTISQCVPATYTLMHT